MSVLFQIISPFKLLQNLEQSSLCYTVGLCWFSILDIAVCTQIFIGGFLAQTLFWVASSCLDSVYFNASQQNGFLQVRLTPSITGPPVSLGPERDGRSLETGFKSGPLPSLVPGPTRAVWAEAENTERGRHGTMLARRVVEIIESAGHPIESHQTRSALELSARWWALRNQCCICQWALRLTATPTCLMHPARAFQKPVSFRINLIRLEGQAQANWFYLCTRKTHKHL